MEKKPEIKAIIGLGNPGSKFYKNRHNIGYRILNALAEAHTSDWDKKDSMELCKVHHEGKPIFLIKPLTFMNASGKVIHYILKQGIKPENILVVHDELELPFGKIKLRFGGSAKGHNGLRSIIDVIGKNFWRLSFGIGRPQQREEVGNYVLSDFSENPADLEESIGNAVMRIGKIVASSS